MTYSARILAALAAAASLCSCKSDEAANNLANLSLLYDLCAAAPEISVSAPAADGSRNIDFRAVISNPGVAEAHGSVDIFMWVTGSVPDGQTIQPTPLQPVMESPNTTTYAANTVKAYTTPNPMIRIRHDPRAIYSINVYKTIPGQPNWDAGNPCYRYRAQRVIPG